MTVDEGDLPAEVLSHPAAWTGCTAGALTERDFARKLGKAGFGEVQILDPAPSTATGYTGAADLRRPQ